MSYLRPLRGGPAFDMDHVINHVWTRERPLRFETVLTSGIELHCTATDADRAEIVDLTDLRSQEEICGALRASGRLPWLAGGPVSFRGMRLLDATLAEAIPVHVARSSATDLLVLQTRPHGVGHTPLSPAGGAPDRPVPAGDQPGAPRAAADPLPALRRAHRRARHPGGRSGACARDLCDPACRRLARDLAARASSIGAAARRR